MSRNASPRTRSRRAATAAILALGALTSAVLTDTAAASTPPDSAPDGSNSPTGSITVLDAGDPSHTIVLPGIPELGTTGQHTQVSTATGSVVASGADDSSATIDVVTTITQEGEITAADDGGFQLRRTVTSFDAVDNSVGASGDSYIADEELGELVDVPLLADFDAHGALQSLVAAPDVTPTAEQEAAIDEALAGANTVGFPTEPVGVGARWQAILDNDGSQITATYTLTALDGNDYTMEVAFKSSAEEFANGSLPTGFTSIEGTVTGTGEFQGRVGEPFARSATTTLVVDLTFIGDDIEVASDITMVEEQTTVPG